MRFLSVTIIIILTGIILQSCDDEKTNHYTPQKIRVGILSDGSKTESEQRFTPYLRYLEAEIGTTFELVVPDNYEQLIELFAEKKVDIAYFGAYTFWKTHLEHSAKPLMMRNVDRSFSSNIITLKQNSFESLEDLQQKSLSFGPKLSTSGHVMPRYFLNLQGIEAENYFSEVSHSASHNQTI